MCAVDQIIQSYRAIVKEQPYSKITVYQICDRAGVSRKTFYVNFHNKDDILARIIHDEVIDPLTKVADVYLSMSDEKKLLEVLPVSSDMHIYRAFLKDKEFYSRLVAAADSVDSPLVDAITKELYQLNDYVFKAIGYEPPAWQRDYMNYFFSSSAALIIQRWIRGGYQETPEQMAQLFNDSGALYWKNLAAHCLNLNALSI